MPKLSVIILSYNTYELTEQCITELSQSLDLISSEIIIIDNASTDGSVQMLKKFQISHSASSGQANFKFQIKYNKINVGYPKGNNQALKLAKGEYVLFLNSDVIIKKVHFKQLLQYLDTRTDVGALTVNVILPTGKIDPASHRGFPTLWNSFSYFLKLEFMFSKIPLLNKIFGGYHMLGCDFRTIHEIDSPSGAFYLTRKSILDKIGGFDESFFMYGEDLDLSYRIKELGYKILYYPLDCVIHMKSASGLKHNNLATRKTIKKHFYSSMQVFYKKHYEAKYPKFINTIVFKLIFIKKYLS